MKKIHIYSSLIMDNTKICKQIIVLINFHKPIDRETRYRHFLIERKVPSKIIENNLNWFCMLFANYFLSAVIFMINASMQNAWNMMCWMCMRNGKFPIDLQCNKRGMVAWWQKKQKSSIWYIIVVSVSNYFQFIECGYDTFRVGNKAQRTAQKHTHIWFF